MGQLPSLKQSWIEGMDGVKEVGVEFYGQTRVSGDNWEHWEDI